MKLVYWSIAAPLTLVAVLFAISNRDIVELGLWPLPDRIAVPLYLVALGALAAGFLAGGAVAWFGAGRARRRARAAERRAAAQKREIEALERRLAAIERSPTPPPEGTAAEDTPRPPALASPR